MHGGQLIAKILAKQGVKHLFTLCGGHISPILVGAKQEGIRVVDVRNEANAVFAADATSRLTNTVGTAAVTAGPGVTNTITAVKNASLAQSPLILLGGATATALKGRGSLQDIDQMALMKPHVKWATTIKKYKEIIPKTEEAFKISQSGTPGPVFIECPMDVMYDEKLVREGYTKKRTANNLKEKIVRWYLNRHVNRIFKHEEQTLEEKITAEHPEHTPSDITKAQELLKKSKRPLMLIGSQAVLDIETANELAAAVEKLNIPVYLSGMARGLLGPNHPLQLRHDRKAALKEADLTLLAGMPCDFRLNYGQHIKSTYISVNRNKKDLHLNKKPDKAIHADPSCFLQELSTYTNNSQDDWLQHLQKYDNARKRNINEQAKQTMLRINPIKLLKELDKLVDDDSIIIGDGGDFVATASYVLRPRGPLRWLDPGVFGTLGVGAGFALGAKLCRPESEVWIIYGDGSAGYSIAEYDTFVRHNVPVISVVGNDARWSQIARDQINILNDDIATALRPTDYDAVAKAYGGDGSAAYSVEDFIESVKTAKQKKVPYLINAIIEKTDFRDGSTSI